MSEYSEEEAGRTEIAHLRDEVRELNRKIERLISSNQMIEMHTSSSQWGYTVCHRLDKVENDLAELKRKALRR